MLEETKKGRQVAQVLEIGEEIPKSSANAPAGGTAIVRPRTLFATRGTVKWYNAEKGFGFISPEGEGKDVFVHASALSRSGLSALAEGQKVLFEQGLGKKGLEVQTIRIG
ncbi:MAG: cold-shock protein [Mesorhizobium sp.]|nr:cold-shock protein [Mesorhizobium sp. M2A.F.Ca.ET.015.02.1.1]RVC96415.1 cold-shock protein [Mesorhizobium sp. M2A.F.Ca.ET.029.05.1.1]RWC83390.1 MAG: cold-shock protein [Mesorhizobium sp.]RWF56199.1 MAG: cold-shock protein [Mesorhizobium sp.]